MQTAKNKCNPQYKKVQSARMYFVDPPLVDATTSPLFPVILFFIKKVPQRNSKGLCKKEREKKREALPFFFRWKSQPSYRNFHCWENQPKLFLFFSPFLFEKKNNPSPACDTSPPPRGGFWKATNPVARSDFLCGSGANRRAEKAAEATPIGGMS